jgi:hypothetical protein
MTMPQAPGAPEGTPSEAAPGAQPPVQQQRQPQPQSQPEPAQQTQDVSQLPDWAQKQLKDLRNEAAKARTTAKQTAAEDARQQLLSEFASKLGLSQDGQPTVEGLQQELSSLQEQLASERDNAAAAAYENTVIRVARDVGADAEALLDSDSFYHAVREALGEEGFDDDDLKKAVEKHAREYAKKPRFAATQAAPRSGGDFTGGPQAAASIDTQIAEAEKNRDFATAIALKRQRAQALAGQ